MYPNKDMVRSVITAIEYPEILLLSREGVFSSELEKALQTLHFTVKQVSPDLLIQGGGVGFLADLRSAFAVVWIDSPLFSHQSEKKHSARQIVDLLSQNPVPVWFVGFDLSHTRRKSQIGTDPTWGSMYVLHLVKQRLPQAFILEYLHTIYPFEGGLSFVHRFIVEKIQKNISTQLTGEFSPIWYQDVIDDLIKHICASRPQAGVFTGSQRVSVSDFEEGVRRALQYPKFSQERQEFPYQFSSAEPLRTRDVEQMIEEISLSLPKKSLFVNPVLEAPTSSQEDLSVIPNKSKQRKVKRSLNRAVLVLRVILVSILLAGLIYAVSLALFVSSLYRVKAEVQRLVASDFTVKQGASLMLKNRQTLELITILNARLWIPYSVLGFPINRSDLDQVVSGLSLLSQGLEEQSLATTQMQTAYEQTFYNQVETKNPELDQVLKNLTSAQQQLSSTQARLVQNGPFLDALFGNSQLSKELLDRLTAVRESNTIQYSVASIWKDIFLSGKKTVAVVMVDSLSPRPIGGIPRSVALLTLDSGRILTIDHYSVNELDAALIGEAEAPEELRRRFGKETWKLGDGTFSLDGPTAAKQISWFLTKGLRVEVDAVWVLTPQALEQILPYFSEIEVNSTRLTPKNITQALYEFSTQYVSGDTRGWKEMGVMTLEKLSQARGETVGSLALALANSLSLADSLVYLKDDQLQKTIQTLGWDGSLVSPSCPTTFISSFCRVEHSYLSEYGTGGTATSPLVERLRNHEVAVTEEGVNHIQTIIYKNQASNEVWPQGSFPVLVKYAINADSTVVGVFVGGEELPAGSYDVSGEFGKQVISFEIEVLPQSSLEVKIIYSSPPLPKTGGSLVIYEQKQLGQKAEPLTVTVSYGDSFYAKKVAPVAQIQKRRVVFDTILNQHRIFALGF